MYFAILRYLSIGELSRSGRHLCDIISIIHQRYEPSAAPGARRKRWGPGGSGERSTEKRATRRVGRGNYVFRESTELHSTEELWIGALPRCRCEKRAIPKPPHLPVTFSIGTTDKRTSERKRESEREGGMGRRRRKRREASATRRRRNKRRYVNEIK